MSGNDGLSQLGQELLEQWPYQTVQNYITLATSVMMLYDYLITLHIEISEIWHGNLTATKILFYLNRYSSLLYQLTLSLSFFLHTEDVGCNVLARFSNATSTIAILAYSLIFTFRTFAIYEKSWIILIVLSAFAIAQVALSAYLTVIFSAIAVPPVYREGPYACLVEAPADGNQLNMVLAILTIVFDTLVFLFTASKTLRDVLMGIKERRVRLLGYLLLRDGTIYYVPLLTINIVLSILLAATQATEDVGVQSGLVDLEIVGNALTFVIVNRLVLNLNHELHSHGRDRFETSLLESAIASSPVLGNIGGPLKTDGYYFPNEEIRTLEFELQERRRTNRLSIIELENNRSEDVTFDRAPYKLLGQES